MCQLTWCRCGMGETSMLESIWYASFLRIFPVWLTSSTHDESLSSAPSLRRFTAPDTLGSDRHVVIRPLLQSDLSKTRMAHRNKFEHKQLHSTFLKIIISYLAADNWPLSSSTSARSSSVRSRSSRFSADNRLSCSVSELRWLSSSASQRDSNSAICRSVDYTRGPK